MAHSNMLIYHACARAYKRRKILQRGLMWAAVIKYDKRYVFREEMHTWFTRTMNDKDLYA